MADLPPTLSDQQMERMIGALLRAGLIAAAAVVLVGGVVYVTRHAGERPDYRLFRGEPVDLRSIAGIAQSSPIVSGVTDWKGRTTLSTWAWRRTSASSTRTS